MDRDCPDYLRETTLESKTETINWILESKNRNYKNTKPIVTPRFIPSVTDEMLFELKNIVKDYKTAVQSHLSENPSEIEYVKELTPYAKFYGDAYDRFNLLGRVHEDNTLVPTIMAHCVYSNEEEIKLLKDNQVFVAHCPSSNLNVASGIAPIKKYLDLGLNIGLGSDVAGGETESIFKQIVDAIKSSKMYYRYVDSNYKGLTFEEGFYLATLSGGKFFGKCGSFMKGYDADIVVIDDNGYTNPNEFSIINRLEKAVYFNLDENHLIAKFVHGNKII